MTITHLFVPEWDRDDLDRHGVVIAALVEYCDNARRFGLTDDEIGEDIDAQWPGLIPGGSEVRTGADKVIWVSSGSFIRGEGSSG
jgi:hypothetical protein